VPTLCYHNTIRWLMGITSFLFINVLTHWGRDGSFKLFKRPFPGFLTILILACWDRGFEFHGGMDICLLWVSCVVR